MGKIWFLTNLIIISIFAIGCSESDKSPISPTTNDDSSLPTLDSQFYLKVGETTTIKSENIAVKFLEVTGDSRCPSDVVCVWAGQVSVMVNVAKNGENLGDITLTLGVSNPELAIKNVGGYYIKVTAVNPYPISTHKIEQSEYIATLVVSKI
jgi:hypothetical protein